MFDSGQINLTVGWLWVVLGFLFGFILGSYFHQEQWLGGYTSLKRRLYRLAHISVFGMAITNILFYFTLRAFTLSGLLVDVASGGFIVAAVSMPTCCFLMAHNTRLRVLFLIPVVSLVLAGSITFWEVIGL